MPTDETIEEWRDIPDLPGYQVSDKGRVRSSRRNGSKHYDWPWRILKCGKRGGYPAVHIYSLSKSLYVHHLVLEVFVGPRPEGLDSRHRDNDYDNCKLSNLWWGTVAQNMRDAVLAGRTSQKLNPDSVRAIREMKRKGGITQTEMGRIFGVGQDQISRVCTGKRWGWLDTHVV